MTLTRAIGILVLTSVAVVTSSRASHACATVQMLPAPVPVASEEALIVWDAAHHIEHFVRGAEFAGGGDGMGFIVPTPTRPELAALQSDPFGALDFALVPRRRNEVHHSVVPGCSLSFFMFMRGAAPGAAPQGATTSAAHVSVLEERRIGPYDASILSADSADALAQWLASHGFVSRPSVVEWLRPYVEHHWLLTAFRIAPNAGSSANRLPAVRMSFPTERPFYPYSEPAETAPENATSNRSLHVFFVADTGYEAGRGDSFQPWSAHMPLSASIADEPDSSRVSPALTAVAAPGARVAHRVSRHEFAARRRPRSLLPSAEAVDARASAR
jgi:hypothetical protein